MRDTSGGGSKATQFAVVAGLWVLVALFGFSSQRGVLLGALPLVGALIMATFAWRAARLDQPRAWPRHRPQGRR